MTEFEKPTDPMIQQASSISLQAQKARETQAPFLLPEAIIRHDSRFMRLVAINSLENAPGLVENGHQIIEYLAIDKDELVRTRVARLGTRPAYQNQVLEKLDGFLDDPSPEVRTEALRLVDHHFETLEDPGQRLLESLNDQDPKVKTRAIELIGIHLESYDDPDALASKITPLAHDPDENVRYAVGGFGRMCALKGADPNKIMSMFMDLDAWETRLAMMNMFSWLFDQIEDKVRWMDMGLKDPHPDVRYAALDLLGRKFFRFERYFRISWLKEMTEDDSPEVRGLAHYAEEELLRLH